MMKLMLIKEIKGFENDLSELFTERSRLESEIKDNLKNFIYGN